MFNPKVNFAAGCYQALLLCCKCSVNFTYNTAMHLFKLLVVQYSPLFALQMEIPFFPFTLIWTSRPFKDQLNTDTYMHICICTLYAIVLRPSCLDHSIALDKRSFHKKLQRCLAWRRSALEHPAPAMQHTLMHHINSSITKQTLSPPERR